MEITTYDKMLLRLRQLKEERAATNRGMTGQSANRDSFYDELIPGLENEFYNQFREQTQDKADIRNFKKYSGMLGEQFEILRKKAPITNLGSTIDLELLGFQNQAVHDEYIASQQIEKQLGTRNSLTKLAKSSFDDVLGIGVKLGSKAKANPIAVLAIIGGAVIAGTAMGLLMSNSESGAKTNQITPKKSASDLQDSSNVSLIQYINYGITSGKSLPFSYKGGSRTAKFVGENTKDESTDGPLVLSHPPWRQFHLDDMTATKEELDAFKEEVAKMSSKLLPYNG